MSAPPTSASPTSPPSPDGADKPTRAGRLLALVRKLIDYGKELAATIHQRIQAEPYFASARFSTDEIPAILALITRGLHLATALEARIAQRAKHLDAPRPARTPTERKTAAAPRTARVEAADAHLTQFPTAEQIAEQIRRRPIGAVIADICRDLGIMPVDPLWREIHIEIIREGGSLARLFGERAVRSLQPHLAQAAPGSLGFLRRYGLQLPAPVATGPP